MIEPALRDLRQQRVLTKSDLDSLTNSTSTDLSLLSSRVDRLERQRPATQGDLEELRQEFDQKLLTLKPGNP
jgi:chaperonin cofactor prefoldin